MAMGPVQLLVIGFEDPEFKGDIRAELDKLRESDVIRLIDAIVVRKDEDGNVEKIQISDLTTEEAEEYGATVGALIGFGFGGDEENMEAGAVLGAVAGEDGHILGEDSWYVDDAIPNGSAPKCRAGSPPCSEVRCCRPPRKAAAGFTSRTGSPIRRTRSPLA